MREVTPLDDARAQANPTEKKAGAVRLRRLADGFPDRAAPMLAAAQRLTRQ